jgi:lipoprotein-releasing system ATP-binding protein
MLHVLAGLDQADEGRIQLLGQSLTDLSARDLAVFRNQKLGFVYQFHHLMAELSVLENVALPALIKGLKKTEANHQAKTLLKEVGLNHRLQHFPWQLSGGERQRCAIARALINQPAMLFADEPTGNLDHVAAEQASSLLIALSKDRGATVVLVTHNMSLAAKADRVLNLHEGRLS